jgi:hypothetical protein
MGHPVLLGWLVADGEAGADVVGVFELVDEGDGVVLHGTRKGRFCSAQSYERVSLEQEQATAKAGFVEQRAKRKRGSGGKQIPCGNDSKKGKGKGKGKSEGRGKSKGKGTSEGKGKREGKGKGREWSRPLVWLDWVLCYPTHAQERA